MNNKASIAIGVLTGLYVLSYCVLSVSGHYTPKFYGARSGPGGSIIIASKGFGEIWIPFDLSNEPLHLFYWPLIQIDHLAWHRERPG